MLIHSQPLLALVDELQRRGLPVPDEVQRGCELLRSISPQRLLERPVSPSLLALTEEQLRDHLDQILLDRLDVGIWRNEIARNLSRDIATEVGAILLEGFDDLLDQLRPAFDPAGLAVHQATQLGIKPGMPADHVLGLTDAAVAAWRALPGHLQVLDDVAQLRLRITDVLGAVPTPSPLSDQTPYAACFTTTGGPWAVRGEDSRRRWLRLAGPEPLRLLTADETTLAAGAHRTPPPSLGMTEDEDGYMVPAGYRGSHQR